MTTQTEQLHALFERYLDICNQAIEAHKDEFPYKHVWEAAESLLGDEGVHLTLYDDEPKGDYQLHLHDKQLDVTSGSDEPPSKGWRMNSSYLRQVVENPEEYIKEPAKLDWHWLKNRAGLNTPE